MQKFKLKQLDECKKLGIKIPDALEVVLEAGPVDYQKLESVTGILAEPVVDKRRLRQLAIYGAKGAAAYARHAANLKYEDDDVYAHIEKTLKEVSRQDITVDDLLKTVLYMGEGAVKAELYQKLLMPSSNPVDVMLFSLVSYK